MLDWQELSFARTEPSVVDPRRRLRYCFRAFLLLLFLVWCRALELEISQGAAFREECRRPVRSELTLPAARGRILARDGSVLACDREVNAVAVEYHYLEDPPRQAWLETLARKRLPKDERGKPARLVEEVAKLRAEREDLHRRLAALCGLDLAQWRARGQAVQKRVERIAADARRRQIEAALVLPTSDDPSWTGRISSALHDIFEPARDALPENVTVTEELTDHVLAEDIPAAAVAEIERHAEQFPGTRIVRLTRRSYPCGTMAAHVLGYLGRTGVERQCDAILQGQPGTEADVTDHAGRLRQAVRETEPVAGRDVTLTLDPRLQRTAEELLDGALKRVALESDGGEPSGGAIVVLDVSNGEILAAASAPRFDPAVFQGDDSARREALLADPAHPLFHRAIQMALPPGSVFKTATAVALLESGGLDPAETFYCQGYLKQPDRQRCAIYVRHGTGHGDVTLADALAESCNVYFFHHAETLPPEMLTDWAGRLGFGQATGIDLPGEARGLLPAPDAPGPNGRRRWQTADTQAMAVGQGSLTATPLQVVRMMAAVANGGLLVTPHVMRSTADGSPEPSPRPVPGLSYATLASIRQGLLQAVTDPRGTAHASLSLDQVSVAGKTGTAEIGEGRPDHAWFAGYVPADRPRYAMVVVLERAGDAATAACPVARRLVLRMLETGLLEKQ